MKNKYKTISEIAKMNLLPYKESWYRTYLERSEFAPFRKSNTFNVCPEFIKLLKTFYKEKTKKIPYDDILKQIKKLCLDAKDNTLADEILEIILLNQ